ncbi:MAG: hypothetical protein HY376_04300, partial [Candidatus Blackburnbacteria bacterium]|nr:hypothetical protein [Candidatus Blackburnbacteria bacterium]
MSASVVIGQSDFTSNSSSVSSASLFNPRGVFVDPKGRLIIADNGNHRVLIWNSIPTTNGASADLVLGQADFVSSSANRGGTIAANTLNSPRQIWSDGEKLLVADGNNHRVLLWNTFPTSNGQSADVVIGQADFASAATTCNSLTTRVADGILVYNGKLLVSASSTHQRVLIWNSIPTTNGVAADVVIGQPDMTTCSSSSASANTLQNSDGNVVVVNNKLIVADHVNHRVLIFNQIPTTNNASADIVLGQVDFATIDSTGTTGANNTRRPIDIISDDTRLFIATNFSSRVIIHNSIPTSNTAGHDISIGQPNLTDNTSRTTVNGMGNPIGMTIAEKKLIVADNSNNRLLIFSNILPDTKLTNTLVSGIENGKQRFRGTASTNVVNGVVRYVEYSINGSTWTGATPTDGQFNDATEDYSFDFDPTTNNPDLVAHKGFVIRVRNTHNNTIDSGSSAVYFEPFVANSPQDKTVLSPSSSSSSSLPSFSFSINTWRFEDLVKDLDSFRIAINKDNKGWVPYIENIPVSYEKVRDSSDNKRRSVVPSSGNGIYEDKTKLVTYTSNNATIEVQAKAVNRQTGDSSDKDWDNGGFLLPRGSYQWRVEAVDRAGHTQATGERTLFVGGSRQIITSRSWFPLTIDSFTGVGNSLDWSSVHP